MVYMAAHLDTELDAAAVKDLREMESARLDSNVHVYVQIDRHWPDYAQRYQIKGQQAVSRSIDKAASTGSPESLSRFLKWVLRTDKYERRQYLLVLWGHAYGLGFGRDHGDALTIEELRGALETFKTSRKPKVKKRSGAKVSEGPPLELLGANACALSYVEAAYQLRHVVRHVAASQIAVPYAGWPFERVLSDLKPPMSSEQVGRLIVDRYVSSFHTRNGLRVAMSLLDLSRFDATTDLGAQMVRLSEGIRNLVNGRNVGATDSLAHVRAAFSSAAAGDVRPLVDLKDLCDRLTDVCTDLQHLRLTADVQTLEGAAKAISAALVPQYVMPLEDEYEAPGSGPIVMHKRHVDLLGLNGLGIFAPFVTTPADLKRLGLAPADRADVPDERKDGRPAYESLELVSNARWATLVYDVLQAGIPNDIVTAVESSSMVDRADRAAVAQMLVGLDATFDVLDRRIAAAKRVAITEAGGAAGPVGPSRPGQFLNLQLLKHDDVREAAKKARTALRPEPTGPRHTSSASSDGVVAILQDLETTVQSLERTVRRTLTDGTFGLGPGPTGSVSLTGGHGIKGGGLHGIKGGGLHGAPDFGKGGGLHGAPEFDKGGGLHGAPDFIKGGGLHGPGAGEPGLAIGTLSSTPASEIAALFAEVGAALLRLESGISDVETVLALVRMPRKTSSGAPNELQIRQAFRVAAEASTEARRAVRRVLADPLYGFGPGPETIGIVERQDLARAGGLTTSQLKLL
jgi:hypothetical protein